MEERSAADPQRQRSPSMAAAADTRPLSVAIVSDVCFLRQALAEILERDPSISVIGQSGDLGELVTRTPPLSADVVLVDAKLRDGPAEVRRARHIASDLRVIAYGVEESPQDVIIWAEAGAIGYIPNTAPAAHLASLVIAISSGRQPCPEPVASSLFRRIAATARSGTSTASSALALTRRERQVAELIGAGYSDKEIARRLNISLWTAKSHVHNLLGKLGVYHRGEVSSRLRLHEQHSLNHEPAGPAPSC
jgi:DNA-binding NarL/FixJ family response regulator